MKIRYEEHLGVLLGMAAVAWSAWQIRLYLSHASPLWFRAEPLEVAALGLLVWLHAKWRRSVSGEPRH